MHPHPCRADAADRNRQQTGFNTLTLQQHFQLSILSSYRLTAENQTAQRNIFQISSHRHSSESLVIVISHCH